MQSEHLGDLRRGKLAHDIDLYRQGVLVSSTNLRKTADLQAIFAGFSADLRTAKNREQSSPR
jgi:hypothetical protein